MKNGININKTVILISSLLLFFLWDIGLYADKQKRYESIHDFSVYDLLKHKHPYSIFADVSGNIHFANTPIISPIPIQFNNIDYFTNYLNTGNMAGLPVNIFQNFDYSGTNKISFGNSNNRTNLPLMRYASDSTYLGIETKFLFSPDKLATSFGIVDETHDNYFYTIKANYWQGIKRYSKNIPKIYEAKKSSNEDLDYNHISTFAEIGFKDKNSRISLSYLLLNNKYRNLFFQQDSLENIFLDNNNFSQLINFSFLTNTSTEKELYGNIYYRNTQDETYRTTVISNFTKQDNSEFGANLSYHIIHDRKKDYDINLSLRYSNIANKIYSEKSWNIQNENITIESNFDIKNLYGNISYSLGQYSNYNQIENRIATLNCNVNWITHNYSPSTFSMLSLVHNSSPLLWWLYPADNRLMHIHNSYSTQLKYGLFSSSSKSINKAVYFHKERSLEVSVGRLQFSKNDILNINENSIFNAGGKLDLPIRLYKKNILDIDINYQHIFNPDASLYYIPNFAVNLTLFNLIENWNLYYYLNFQYSYRYQEKEHFKYQDYILLNAMLSYEIFDNFNISLNFKNIFDNYYELYPGLPAQGSTIEFGIIFSPQLNKNR